MQEKEAHGNNKACNDFEQTTRKRDNMNFPQMKEFYEFFDAKFRADRAGKPVHVQLSASYGAGKSTLIGYEYRNVEGHYLIEGNITEDQYVKHILNEVKSYGSTSLTHEDITKVPQDRDFIKLASLWQQITDGHVTIRRYGARFDEPVRWGLLITYPSGSITGKKAEVMKLSGLDDRMLHANFDTDRDLRRLMTFAWRHQNLQRRQIYYSIPVTPITEDIEDKVFNLQFSGRQHNLILNLIEYGCSLDTIIKFCGTGNQFMFKG